MRFYICLFCVLLVCAGSVNGNVNEAAKDDQVITYFAKKFNKNNYLQIKKFT